LSTARLIYDHILLEISDFFSFEFLQWQTHLALR